MQEVVLDFFGNPYDNNTMPNFNVIGKTKRFALKHPKLSLLASGLALWFAVTFPLASNFADAVPYADRRATSSVSVVREMVPGDHIQLLYHFWLCRDMIAGKTPPFANVYEFNTGDDAKRFRFDPYYAPFSIVYAVVSPFLGNAAGWNCAGLFSVLLGLFGTYMLVGRFSRSTTLAAVIALVATAFPYRWITLLGGSPTGFAMSLAPWLLFGLDKAVRDKSVAGGLTAGMAIFFSYCSDLHTFYFGVLLSPVWCLFSWLLGEEKLMPSLKSGWRILVALAPFMVLVMTSAIIAAHSGGALEETTMAAGRSISEVKLSSPIASGLFRWQRLGIANHIFFGNAMALLLAFGLVANLLLRKGRRSPDVAAESPEGIRRPALGVAFLLFCVAALVLLAMGTAEPFGGLPIRVARKIIPKYVMIRQPMKIFCVMPPVLAVLSALIFAPVVALKTRKVKGATVSMAISAVLVCAVFCETIAWFSPALCRLPRELPAYRAAVEDAAKRGIVNPRAIVIPLWPGDSHWSSLYEYGVICSRLRLVNGYSPSAPGDYCDEVFSKLESLNCGVMSRQQQDILKAFGVNYLIFHEQPYPTKVSPFPSAVALRRLRSCESLRFIETADAVWTFEFTDGAPETSLDVEEKLTSLAFPASFHWSAKRLANVAQNPIAGAKYNLRLRAPVPRTFGLRYMMLASGGGKLRSDSGREIFVPVEKKWISAEFELPYGQNFEITEGAPVIEWALVAAGRELQMEPGESVTWRAADLFHSGVSDPETGEVRFSPSAQERGVMLYGPDIPFPCGEYSAKIEYAAIRGEPRYGSLSADSSQEESATNAFSAGTVACGDKYAKKLLDASGSCEIHFLHDGLTPLRLQFYFNGTCEVSVKSVSLSRLNSASRAISQ